MTTRETLSVVLVLQGAVAVVVGAAAQWGWCVGLLVAGLVVMVLGLLLGWDAPPAAPPTVDDELSGDDGRAEFQWRDPA